MYFKHGPFLGQGVYNILGENYAWEKDQEQNPDTLICFY